MSEGIRDGRVAAISTPEATREEIFRMFQTAAQHRVTSTSMVDGVMPGQAIRRHPIS